MVLSAVLVSGESKPGGKASFPQLEAANSENCDNLCAKPPGSWRCFFQQPQRALAWLGPPGRGNPKALGAIGVLELGLSIQLSLE